MASSSSPIGTPQWKYDVFLSFRGENTRDNFTAHLYDALCRNHIDAYIDYQLRGGEKIEQALLERIEESYISVVILSENYADSTFCLKELSKILECKTKGQIVIPVFYHVVPSDIRKRKGSFGDALARHEKKGLSKEVESWERALKEIANLKGWDSSVTKPETKLIEEIVDDIFKKINLETSSSFDGLVGIDSQVKEIESLLYVGAPGVCIVGIWGMGGIGKTTIAEVIYNQISSKFEGRFFLPNIRQELERSTLVALRNKILSGVLEKDLNIGTLNLLPMPTKRMLQRKKVLIVLDDVSSSQQLKALVGEAGLLGQGSRIIVTSRDKQVLKNRCDQIYKVKELGNCEALRLFRLHAFQQICPTEKHMQLSERMVEYAKGIPLALKVLGSNLFDKDLEEWESEFAKLQSTLDMEIEKILRISYDGLEPTEKSIFLDIACFFRTCSKDRAQKIFDQCGFFATRGISRLNDKCLINISRDLIWMHDLLQKLGQDIVCDECINDPRKRSRLWIPEDICHVLTHYTGTETVEAISLDMSKIEELKLHRTVFREMCNLRLLKFYGPLSGENKIFLAEGLEFLSKKLRVLHWDRYPLKSLPSSFCPKNLVELRMINSNLEEFRSEFPCLVNLKLMDLSRCKNLIWIPDLSKVPNLEILNLRGCKSLVRIPSSIGHCNKITGLHLSGCDNLCGLPSLLYLTSLKSLYLNNCAKIEEFPEVPSNIQRLNLGGTLIKHVHSSIGHLSHLRWLNLSGCKRLESVSSRIGQLKYLVSLHLGGCCKLASLPNSIYDLESLETLIIDRCENLKRLPKQIEDLESQVGLSSSLKTPSSIGHLGSVQELFLTDCGILEIPDIFGSMVSLRALFLEGNHFESLPASIKQLSNLKELHLKRRRRLQRLPELPSRLENLDVSYCRSLKSVHGIFPQVHEEYAPGYEEAFDFFNCCCLDEKARFQIMADSQLRIQRLATFLFNQAYRGPTKVDIRFHGNQVPKWLTYKNNEGSSLKVITPHHSYNNSQFLGGAFCVVVAPKDYDDSGNDGDDEDSDEVQSYDYFDVEDYLYHEDEVSSSDDDDLDEGWAFIITCECRLITGHGCHDLFLSLAQMDYPKIDKPHAFILYDSGFSSNRCFDEASFKFAVRQLRDDSLSKRLQVIKCGVHLLKAKDDGIDEQQRCKRLKTEEGHGRP